MRFWDSSAIVPLVAPELVSEQTIDLYRQDKEILAWVLTPTEVISALCRKVRQGSITREQTRGFRSELESLMKDWSEINAVELVRHHASHLHCRRSCGRLSSIAETITVTT